jgi:hypothetical protein
MKHLILSLPVLAIAVLASTSLAADYADWVAKGYRWSVVHGRVACVTKEEAKSTGSKSKSDSIGHGYYLRPGKLVLVVENRCSLWPFQNPHEWRSVASLDCDQKSE